MALPDLFSRRKRQASGNPEVYQYDTCSPKLRQQIIQMINEANRDLNNGNIYPDLISIMRKELGVPKLSNEYAAEDEFNTWLTNYRHIDYIIDSLEVASRLIKYYTDKYGPERALTQFRSELNARMLEAGFGFQLEDGQIFQISSQFVHTEIVVPALVLLNDPKYVAAETEFRQAHSEFRAGEYEDCIHDCGNALESVLKVILTEKGWVFNKTDTASKLISVAFANNLIPSYMQTEFTGLRTILESGTPTVRNKSGGHGAGANPRNIPAYIAAFQLHQTAAAIALLAEAAK